MGIENTSFDIIAVDMESLRDRTANRQGELFKQSDNPTTGLQAIDELNANVKMTHLADGVRYIAEMVWNEAEYDGVSTSICQKEGEPDLYVDVPKKSSETVTIFFNGDMYTCGDPDIVVNRFDKASSVVKKHALNMPDLKAFTANVDQILTRGRTVYMTPYKKSN